MSSELYDLYQEVILDHNKRPRNFGALDDADRSAAGHNPLCGDRLTVYLKLDNDGVAEISFDGSGCAISKASASIMTDAVKGKSRAEIERLFEEFHELLTGDPSVREKASAELGKLAVFGANSVDHSHRSGASTRADRYKRLTSSSAVSQ